MGSVTEGSGVTAGSPVVTGSLGETEGSIATAVGVGSEPGFGGVTAGSVEPVTESGGVEVPDESGTKPVSGEGPPWLSPVGVEPEGGPPA